MEETIALKCNMKKILITGGSGFIGTHLVERLHNKGYKVGILDIYKPEYIPDGVKFYWGSVTDSDMVFDLVSEHDGVINLAGKLGTMETVERPMPSVRANIIGALNIFDACRFFNKKCVQITVGNHFMNNSYSITKSTSERFALMYNKEHNTKISVVRGLNVFGEKQKHAPIRKVTPNLVIPALLGKDITIYGDGNQIMDMIYVKDVCEILERALVIEHRSYDKVFEAGTGEDLTINDFLGIIMGITKSRSKINYVEMRPGETEHAIVKGNPETLKPLNYSKDDMTPLKEGLVKTIEWYRDNLDTFNYNG